MADYIYLLENRLSKAQQGALLKLREIARNKGLTLFLVGGAVRDLTSGSPVRDLDVVVQGNALKLKKDIEKSGGKITGELEPGQALFVTFPGDVRVEVGSTLSATYPKPGKPVFKPASILDDLRRRDFTANAMALSLNDGSYGLLMDPLNGVADIENRELRLVGNYGFIEDPVRMIRAARLMARLGWQMDERTQTRYETGKQEGYISAMSAFQRGYEAEEIFHEEDPLRVIHRLESEGWLKHLAPALSSAKVNVAELDRLRDTQMQFHMHGIYPGTAAANFPYLTAKMPAKDLGALKKSFPNQTFVAAIEALEGQAKGFAAQLSAKSAASPSQAWKLIHSAHPEMVLWAAHTTKNNALQVKFKSFYTDWPQARQRLPFTMMQEMRIVPQLPGYDNLLEKLFFELIDGRLSTPEEMKAYLEPYSPPAPPPPIHLRRPRAAKKEAKTPRSRKKAAEITENLSAILPESASPEIAAPNAAPEKAAKIAPAKAPATKVPAKVKPAAPSAPAKAQKTASQKVSSRAEVKKRPAAPKANVKKAAAPALKAKSPAKQIAKPAAKSAAKPSARAIARHAQPGKAAPAKKSASKAAPKAPPKSLPKQKSGKPLPKKAAKKQTGKPASKPKPAPAKAKKPAPAKKKR